MNYPTRLCRREFLARAALTSAAATLWAGGALPSGAAGRFALPVTVFSKVYQELKLSFEDSAAVTAEAGLDGVDCAVRPGGEVLPERATEDLPRYAEALRQRNVQMLLLTTAIQSPSTPNTEDILRAAKKLGLRYYRLGVWYHQAGVSENKLVGEIKAQLKDLAALNKEVGLCAVFQNHSPGGRKYAGGDLGELYQIVKDFNPEQVGVAYDIGHALIVHGDDWGRHFDQLKPHLKVAYVKDPSRAGRFVPFGEGEVGRTDYFKRLRAMGYNAPVSMHIEFKWMVPDKSQNRTALVKALQNSVRVVRGWIAEAQ
jgi:sugar phosphate isomerase/epimerase